MTRVRVLLLVLAFSVLGTASAAAATRGSTDATVQVGGVVRSVPTSFLGLSLEFDELAKFERLPAFPALLQQLATPGAGPLSLRVGGESADTTYLSPSAPRLRHRRWLMRRSPRSPGDR